MYCVVLLYCETAVVTVTVLLLGMLERVHGGVVWCGVVWCGVASRQTTSYYSIPYHVILHHSMPYHTTLCVPTA